jgi:hypothetical protein
LGADIDGEATGDESGYSVSLSSEGKTVAIGANGNDENGSNSGHTRVFQWNAGDASTPGAWVQMGADIDGEAAADQSGRSVSLSSEGKIVAIGAVYNDDNGSNSGHTRVFQWNAGDASTPGAWVQMGADIDGEAADDYSGYSVSLSSEGKTVAIGANGNDENGSNSGRTRVFQWNAGDVSTPGAWVQMGADIDGEAANDQSGRSVSLSSEGKTVAIGAVYNDENGSNSGHVRVYSMNTISSSAIPSAGPSVYPSKTPSVIPSMTPSAGPSVSPSKMPSNNPSTSPSNAPSVIPSAGPSVYPSKTPSVVPSMTPSAGPSDSPSMIPSAGPSEDILLNVASEVLGICASASASCADERDKALEWFTESTNHPDNYIITSKKPWLVS